MVLNLKSARIMQMTLLDRPAGRTLKRPKLHYNKKLEGKCEFQRNSIKQQLWQMDCILLAIIYDGIVSTR